MRPLREPLSSHRTLGRPALRVVIAIALAAVLTACPYYRTPGDRLRTSVMEYNDGVRWQRWKAAATFLPADKRDDFLARKEAEADSLRITEFEVRDVRPAEDGESADVVVEFTWHRYPSLTMQRTRVQQHWIFRGKSWFLSSQEKVEAPEPSDDPADMF